MAMTGNLYRGMIIKYNGEPWVLLEKEFYSRGKGSSFNRCRLKNVRTGKVLYPVLIKGEEKVDELEVQTRDMQFLYADDNLGYFMNPTTYEQVDVSLDSIPGGTDWLHTEGKYMMTIYEEKVIYVQLPAKMSLVVTQTFDAVRGDSANNATKEATLETGVKVQVPLFIKNGDKIIVNTETGDYFSKA